MCSHLQFNEVCSLVKHFCPEVAHFACAEAGFVLFYAYLQWLGGMYHAPRRHTGDRNAAAASAPPYAVGCPDDVLELGQRPGGHPLAALDAAQGCGRDAGASERMGAALSQRGLLPVGHRGKSHRPGVWQHQHLYLLQCRAGAGPLARL